MKRITEEVFQVGGGGLTSPEDAAVYLIRIHGEAALVDAGCGRSADRLFQHIAACGVTADQIGYLLITHCHYDHTGGAATVRERTGCRIVAHALEAPYLESGDNTVTAAAWYGARIDPLAVDRKIQEEEETVDLGGRPVRAIHVPGHSPGSLVYVLESEGQKVLFGQDVHGPLHPDLLSDPSAYRRSLERLSALEADILCEGHYGVFRGCKEVRDFIHSFL